MVRNNGQQNRKVELILKSSLSSDCGLKFARMKSDLVVIAGQQTAVNTFPFLVHTARHMRKVGNARSGSTLRRTTKARSIISVKS